MNDDAYLKGLTKLINIAEDDLRRRIESVSPEIRHDTNVMTDLIRELVKIERTKLGLDSNLGRLSLTVNKEKTDNKQPDLVGSGRVAGRHYKVAAWIRGDVLDLTLYEPRKR